MKLTPRVISLRPNSNSSQNQYATYSGRKLQAAVKETPPIYNAHPYYSVVANSEGSIASQKSRISTETNVTQCPHNYKGSSKHQKSNSGLAQSLIDQLTQKQYKPDTNLKVRIETSSNLCGNSLASSLIGAFDGISRVYGQADRYNGGNIKPSYQELVQQNKKLRKIIKEEYYPLKKAYDQLFQQHQQREYLISQLQWKIRELGKQLKQQPHRK